MKIAPDKIFRQLHNITLEEAVNVYQILLPDLKGEIVSISTIGYPGYMATFCNCGPFSIVFNQVGNISACESLMDACEVNQESILDYLYEQRLDVYNFINIGEEIETDDIPRPKSGKFSLL